MNLTALIAAAYVEVQRTTGVKPNVTSRLNGLLKRPVEDDFRALARFTPPADRVFLDIGANRGETISAVRLFQPGVPIVAFEPNPTLGALIRAKHGGDPQFTLHAIGLGDAAGSFDLHVPYYKGVAFDGLASFRRNEAETWLTPDRLVGFDAKHQEIRTFECRVARLDAFALKPCFIKIDVQGLEAAVIRGGLDTIGAHKPVVLLENNKPEVEAAELTAMGYVAHALRDGFLVANAYGGLNTFYIHPQTGGWFAAALYA